MATVNICLKVLSHEKKSVKESFQLRQVPKFSSVSELKNFIISSHSEKFDAPTCAFENLEIGFYGPPRGTRFVIRDETTLAEAYSTEKNKWMVIWAWNPPGNVASRKRSCTFQGTSATARNPAKRFSLSSKVMLSVFTLKCFFFRFYG